MKKTALIMIDMQNDFVLPHASQCIDGAVAIMPNLQKVLGTFRDKSLPVFHVYREYREDGSDIEKTRLDDFVEGEKYCVPHTKGCEIVDELSPIEGEYKIVKNRFSAFMNTELDFILRRLKIERIVVCGIQYPNCIRATVFDGVALGYSVTLVTDATAAKTDEIAEANIVDIRNIGVECITTESLMLSYTETNHWNPKTYNKHTAFVSQLALPVVDLLNPKEGERVLDVGCGDGTLAVEMERRGAKVIGVDMSAEMVEACYANGIDAYVGSVTDLSYENAFDSVFSNAMLHWVKDARGAVQNIAKSLKMGGVFVCEFGGEGNAYHLVSAMQEVFAHHPEFGAFNNPWYFPSVEDYKALLESEGFNVAYIEIIPRPTPMDDIGNWLDIFANGVTSHLSAEAYAVFKREAIAILKTTIYSEKEGWMLDYKRLRVKAVKVG